MIDEGADVNFENIFNENNDTTQRVETALHAAVEANHPNIVSLLWELEDIDPDIENHVGIRDFLLFIKMVMMILTI